MCHKFQVLQPTGVLTIWEYLSRVLLKPAVCLEISKVLTITARLSCRDQLRDVESYMWKSILTLTFVVLILLWYSLACDIVSMFLELSLKHFWKNIFTDEYPGKASGCNLGNPIITHVKIKILYAVCFLVFSAIKSKNACNVGVPMWVGVTGPKYMLLLEAD